MKPAQDRAAVSFATRFRAPLTRIPSVRAGAGSPAIRAIAAKAMTVPVSAALALGSTKIVIDHYGIGSYGAFALIIGIPALLPARDLGFGAKVINVVARREALGLRAVEEAIAGAVGRTARFAAVAAVAALALQFTIGWEVLLGPAVDAVPGTAITVALCLFAVGIPGGLAASVLFGLRRLDLVALQAPVLTLSTFGSVGVAAKAGLPLWTAIVASVAANSAVQWVTLQLVVTRLELSWKRLAALARGPASTSFRGWALPMLLISTCGAIAYQTDRVVLSHITGALSVAHYSVVAQMFFPLLGVISSAGYTLWGKYAVERGGDGVSHSGFRQTLVLFTSMGLLAGVFLTTFGPFAIEALLGVRVGTGLCAAFALLLILQAAGLPVGMLMTDKRGLRRQAILFSAMVGLNLGLSILLAELVGTPGPVIASAVTYLGVVLLPSLLFARRYFAVPSLA